MTQDLRRLGRSGMVVSRVGLGCNNFGLKIAVEQARPVVDAAFDAGVTFFDTADSYGDSEVILGELLTGRRADVLVATKFGLHVGGENGPDWGARGSRAYIRRAVERSLRRLRTDWIDLYQQHYPDPQTPIEETLDALAELVREGKVRYIGSSNIRAWHVGEAHWVARERRVPGFVSVQRSYSLLDRSVELELTPACSHYGVSVLPFFPLASGLLTGKYRRGETPPPGSRMAHFEWAKRQLVPDQFHIVEKLEAFAAERGVTLLQVAMGWLAAQSAVGSIIAGATSAEQVRANVAAAGWTPTGQDLASLDAIAPPPSGTTSISSDRET